MFGARLRNSACTAHGAISDATILKQKEPRQTVRARCCQGSSKKPVSGRPPKNECKIVQIADSQFKTLPPVVARGRLKEARCWFSIRGWRELPAMPADGKSLNRAPTTPSWPRRTIRRGRCGAGVAAVMWRRDSPMPSSLWGRAAAKAACRGTCQRAGRHTRCLSRRR